MCIFPDFKYICTHAHVPMVIVQCCLLLVSKCLHNLCHIARTVLKLGILFLRSSYIHEHRFGLSLLTAELHSVTWVYCIFIHSITGEPLCHFQFLAIIMFHLVFLSNLLAYMWNWFPVGRDPGRGNAGSWDIHICSFNRLSRNYPKWLSSLYFSQWCMRVLFSLQYHQHLILSVF